MNFRNSVEEGHPARFVQFQIPGFTTAKFHLRTAALVIYYFVALTVTHFCCSDLSRISRHCRACCLPVVLLEEKECKDEQLSSTLSFMGLPWGKALNEEVTALQGAAYFSSLRGTRASNNDVQNQKRVGNSGDSFDSMLWPQPEII